MTAPSAGESGADLGDFSLKDLLRVRGQVASELQRRKLIQTRNVEGDIAEMIVARAYEGSVALPSKKGWDVQAGGRQLQVKCRVISGSERRAQHFTPFSVEPHEDEADAFVFVIFDSTTYEISHGVEIDRESVYAMSKRVSKNNPHHRVYAKQVLEFPGGADVTKELAAAYAQLEAESVAGVSDAGQ